MTEKEKIKLFLKNKGINPSQFYSQTGLSNGFLDKGKSIGVDKLKIIISSYPDFDLNWFLSSDEKLDLKIRPNSVPNIRPNLESGATNEVFPSDAGNGCKNCQKLEGQIFFLQDTIKAKNLTITEKEDKIDSLNRQIGRLEGENERLREEIAHYGVDLGNTGS